MANLNCEAILASPRYVCGREKKLHTCAHARLAGHGVAKYAAHDVCVNGLPKSGSNKFTRYGRSNRFPNLIMDPIMTRGRWLPYIYNLWAFTKINLIGVRILPLLSTVSPP